MEYALIALAGVVVGFIAGALVYRKHAAEVDKIVQQLKDLQDKFEKRPPMKP